MKRFAANVGIRKYGDPHPIFVSSTSHAAAVGVSGRFLDRQGGWNPPAVRHGYERFDPEKLREWVSFFGLH